MKLEIAIASHTDPEHSSLVWRKVDKPVEYWESFFKGTQDWNRQIEDGPVKHNGMWVRAGYTICAMEEHAVLMANKLAEGMMQSRVVTAAKVIEDSKIAESIGELLNPSQQILLQWLRENNELVPKWAKWVAVDENPFELWCCQFRPIIGDRIKCGEMWVEPSEGGRVKLIGDIPVPNWREAILELDKVDWK